MEDAVSLVHCRIEGLPKRIESGVASGSTIFRILRDWCMMPGIEEELKVHQPSSEIIEKTCDLFTPKILCRPSGPFRPFDGARVPPNLRHQTRPIAEKSCHVRDNLRDTVAFTRFLRLPANRQPNDDTIRTTTTPIAIPQWE
jgi:hypothetical protein